MVFGPAMQAREFNAWDLRHGVITSPWVLEVSEELDFGVLPPPYAKCFSRPESAARSFLPRSPCLISACQERPYCKANSGAWNAYDPVSPTACLSLSPSTLRAPESEASDHSICSGEHVPTWGHLESKSLIYWRAALWGNASVIVSEVVLVSSHSLFFPHKTVFYRPCGSGTTSRCTKFIEAFLDPRLWG